MCCGGQEHAKDANIQKAIKNKLAYITYIKEQKKGKLLGVPSGVMKGDDGSSLPWTAVSAAALLSAGLSKLFSAMLSHTMCVMRRFG